MNQELRRSPRYADFMPITVSVVNVGNDTVLTGPFAARIVDVSNHGACLLLTQVMMHSFHVFHSTRENDSSILKLHIRISQTHDSIDLAARPVWLNSERMEDVKVFKMGVDFSTPLDSDRMHKINKMINTV